MKPPQRPTWLKSGTWGRDGHSCVLDSKTSDIPEAQDVHLLLTWVKPPALLGNAEKSQASLPKQERSF